MHRPILAPLMALVLWTFVMWAWLYATRIPAIRKNKIVMDPQRPGGELLAQLPAEVRWKADNYNNLMEQPTLFYAVALTLALLDADAGLNVITHRHFRRADRDEAPDFRAPLPGSPISESMCAWIALICSA